MQVGKVVGVNIYIQITETVPAWTNFAIFSGAPSSRLNYLSIIGHNGGNKYYPLQVQNGNAIAAAQQLNNGDDVRFSYAYLIN